MTASSGAQVCTCAPCPLPLASLQVVGEVVSMLTSLGYPVALLRGAVDSPWASCQVPLCLCVIVCVCACVRLHVCSYLTCKNALTLSQTRTFHPPWGGPHLSNNGPTAGCQPAAALVTEVVHCAHPRNMGFSFYTRLLPEACVSPGLAPYPALTGPIPLPQALCIRCPNTVLVSCLLSLFLK